MKQILVNEFGDPEKLILHDVPMPSAGDGQIVIKVEAAGVNFSDGMQRRNQYVFPVTLPHRQMENRKTTGKTVLIP